MEDLNHKQPESLLNLEKCLGELKAHSEKGYNIPVFSSTWLEESNERNDKMVSKLETIKADLARRERQWWRKYTKVEYLNFALLLYIAFRPRK